MVDSASPSSPVSPRVWSRSLSKLPVSDWSFVVSKDWRRCTACNRPSSPSEEFSFRLRLAVVGRDTGASTVEPTCLDEAGLVFVLVQVVPARRHSEQGRNRSHLDLFRLHLSHAFETRVAKGVYWRVSWVVSLMWWLNRKRSLPADAGNLHRRQMTTRPKFSFLGKNPVAVRLGIRAPWHQLCNRR